MMLDPQADLGRRAWLPCQYCYAKAPLYLLDFDLNLVWVQCGNCLRRWWHDTGVGVGHRRHPEDLFDVA
ncbi:MAG: hypothetical protein QOG46_873 [Pseudonocardiales bacterium]|jgi:hypothetical protein|nr:hypothetical protein [Pseudonocardiales bacterium]